MKSSYFQKIKNINEQKNLLSLICFGEMKVKNFFIEKN
jgi:hypothetical protein